MKTIWRVLAAIAVIFLTIAIIWRLLSRRYQLECPSWLAWLLDVSDKLQRSNAILDKARIAPGMKVLDAGSGPGRLTLPAAARVGSAGQVVAIDIQPGMMARLHKRLAEAQVSNVQTILGGLGMGLLPANTFDRALLVTVLGEIPNRESALQEIFAALKPGGMLSVTELALDPHFQTMSSLQRMADQAGFAVQEVIGHPLSYTMNLVKP